jgi:hypothetical protein
MPQPLVPLLRLHSLVAFDQMRTVPGAGSRSQEMKGVSPKRHNALKGSSFSFVTALFEERDLANNQSNVVF